MTYKERQQGHSLVRGVAFILLWIFPIGTVIGLWLFWKSIREQEGMEAIESSVSKLRSELGLKS